MDDQKEIIIERVFDVPVEKVWKAWTDPEMIKKWWGPKGFTAPVVEVDFRVGGKYLYCMRGAPREGAAVADFWSTGTYKEIVPYNKIVSTDSFADEKGNIVPSTYYGMEGFTLEMLVIFEFEDLGGKTKLILTHSGIENIDQTVKENMEEGWNQSLDKLEESLKR